MEKLIEMLKKKGIKLRIKTIYKFAKQCGVYDEDGEFALYKTLVEMVEEKNDKDLMELFAKNIMKYGFKSLFKELGFEEPTKEKVEIDEGDIEKLLKDVDDEKFTKEMVKDILEDLEIEEDDIDKIVVVNVNKKGE